MQLSPTLTLNNGAQMPLLGLGTSKCDPEKLVAAVRCAIDCGYRLFDCAFRYGNQRAVGRAIREKIDDGTVTREELFITSKLWRSFHDAEHMDECMDATLDELGLGYVDLFLMHFPQAGKYAGTRDYYLCDRRGRVVTDERLDYVDTWRLMQKFTEDGRARMLGVSNFNAFQMERLLRECSSVKPPVVNQIEVNQLVLVFRCGWCLQWLRGRGFFEWFSKCLGYEVTGQIW